MRPIDSGIVKGRLSKLRALMKENKIDAYLVVTDDFHASEYVDDYFKCREYISGFDGDAGTVVVLPEEAHLWTDGRFFLQAEEELKGTGITLQKMFEPGVPEIEDFLKEKLKDGATLAFDGRTVSSKQFRKLREKLGDAVKIEMKRDLIGEIWDDRPERSAEPVFELDMKYAGKSRNEKLSELRDTLREKKLDGTVIASLDDIAWLLNLRGNDIAYNPVFLSYLIVTTEDADLYLNQSTAGEEIKSELNKENIHLHDYDSFYEELSEKTAGKRILIDPSRVNAAIVDRLMDGAELTEGMNLTTLPKAIKNATEVENERNAHLKDGVAVTKFLYWVKHQIGKERITEISAAKKLEEFRLGGENYRGQSFPPITGYGPHGAIMHYEATEETDVELKPESFFLVDTGGQYLEGTTDITRTIALGSITERQRAEYTAVLKGNLNLANAYFKYGTMGISLDYLAREALWAMNLDYNHGTGHGVGYFLNVHEGPQGIRSRLGETNQQVMEAGMITSDEPGFYLDGHYGIRIENLMVCVEKAESEFGKFLGFETLTVVPYERDAIDVSMLTEKEKQLLNDYHAWVYRSLSPFLSEEENAWLADVTRAV